MAFPRRKITALLSISGIVVLWFTAGRILFPLKADLSPVENPVTDHAGTDWEQKEAAVDITPTKQVYWGDLHIHTALSFDAYLAGTIGGPSEAYRYARGQTVNIMGSPVKMARPLDFAAVTDHSELIGEMYTVQTRGSKNHNAFVPRYFRSVYNKKKEFGVNPRVQQDIFRRALKRGGRGNPKHPAFFTGYTTSQIAWDIILQAAEQAYEPGEFTTFAGFEWSLLDGNAHLHRNVIFRDMIVPSYPMSSLELVNEKQLWDWLDGLTTDGSTVMAIPHNTNLGEGGAFPGEDPNNGNPMDKSYAQLRQDYEPVIEVHQAKGSSEVHPSLWTNDEFSSFENYSFGPPREDNYVRWALKKGLEHENNLGVNPFKFGLIGSTDTHSGTPGNAEESDEFIANHGIVDIIPENRLTQTWGLSGAKGSSQVVKLHEILNPGGLVAVYAEANTRGQIYDGLKSREVYATSGTRIELRFFAGFDIDSEPESLEALIATGYEVGSPMGSTLTARDESIPQFLIWARKDADGANLDRIQVIKGWVDASGEMQERIYNVALSDGRQPDALGNAEAVNAPVNMETGAWAKDKGNTEFLLNWSDPDYDSEVNAFYYLRVLELPTASWRLWDNIRYGSEFPETSAMTVQERAWSSPIWISPSR